ncbi:MAG: hypothetical protein FJ191_12760 [Gammaproteobacteria bacterium]|nr:hypothetical protein [Gammaproteobacteria bacterium]
MKFRCAARGAVLVVGLLGLAGCASQQEPAEQALAGIEKTLAGSGEQLQKYLPEKHAAIVGRVAELRDALQQGEYARVVRQAPAVVDELRRAVADAAIARAEGRIAIEDEWRELSKAIPGMITATDQRLAALAGRPPQGMERAVFRELVAKYEAARSDWGKAATSIDTKNFENTVVAARGLKATITEAMAALGVPAS